MRNQDHPLLQKIWRKKFPHLPLGVRNYLPWQRRNEEFSPHYKLSVFSLNELGSQKENVGPLGFSSQIFIKSSLCYGFPKKLPSIEKDTSQFSSFSPDKIIFYGKFGGTRLLFSLFLVFLDKPSDFLFRPCASVPWDKLTFDCLSGTSCPRNPGNFQTPLEKLRLTAGCARFSGDFQLSAQGGRLSLADVAGVKPI